MIRLLFLFFLLLLCKWFPIKKFIDNVTSTRYIYCYHLQCCNKKTFLGLFGVPCAILLENLVYWKKSRFRKKSFSSPVLNLKCYPKSITNMKERLKSWGRNEWRKWVLSSQKTHEYELETSKFFFFFFCAKDWELQEMLQGIETDRLCMSLTGTLDQPLLMADRWL